MFISQYNFMTNQWKNCPSIGGNKTRNLSIMSLLLWPLDKGSRHFDEISVSIFGHSAQYQNLAKTKITLKNWQALLKVKYYLKEKKYVRTLASFKIRQSKIRQDKMVKLLLRQFSKKKMSDSLTTNYHWQNHNSCHVIIYVEQSECVVKADWNKYCKLI